MNTDINVCIAPAKRIATLRKGNKILKKYNFKTVISFSIEEKEVKTYDYSEWSVSERSGTKIIKVKVFCSKTITELKEKVLNHYNETFKNDKND